MATRIGFDPSTVSDSTARFILGDEFTYNGRTFRYYKNTSGAATVAGDCMRFTATITTANGGTAPNVNRRLVATGGTEPTISNIQCAGIAMGVVAVSNYGFFLVRGYCATVAATAGMAAAVSITPSTATDALVMATAAATSNSCGVSITAEAAGFCTAWIEV